jgi:hypothetical protein
MRYDMAATGTRTLVLPIGKASDWRPAEITVTHTTTTSYTYRAEVFNLSAVALGWTLPGTVDKVSKAHYWDIDRYTTGTNTKVPSAGLSGNQTIRLYYGLNDNVPDAANLTICKNLSTALTTWFDIGGSGATNFAGSVTSSSTPSAFSSFSRFTLGNRTGGTNPLPVTLVYFKASCNASNTLVEWTTATEINNDFFTVESSKDGITWHDVKQIKGAGNSSVLVNYNCALPALPQQTSFYRLKQTDYDGAFEYSDVIIVKDCKSTSDDVVTIYPNPGNGVLNCRFSGINESIQSVEVYNLMGKLVYTSPVFESQMDLSNLPVGVYSVNFYLNTQTIVKRITILK